ncbi:ribonuclease H-like domain-containing protein [Panaeolus papilionaceus]|nr:ribonuclease H-like domain-containing protein [Panaeolus papilionaceus]
MPKAGYYAVQKGRTTGIFDTWGDCEAQVKGFVGAKFKKFSNRAEAEVFVRGEGPASSSVSAAPSTSSAEAKLPKPTEPLEDDELGYLVVYTDGACKGNGKSGSVAGIGVWWGPNDPRNIAERCPGDQTNNRAELIAILRMLEETPISSTPLLVKSDSQYSINCLTNWIFKWQSNGFRLGDGSPIKNAGIIKSIWAQLGIREASGQKFRFKYVKGHSGHYGNDGADDMANRGAMLPAVEERDWDREEQELQQRLQVLQQSKSKSSVAVQPTATITPTSIAMEPAPSTSKSKLLSTPTTNIPKPRITNTTPTVKLAKIFNPANVQSPLKVIYAAPPLVPVDPSDVNFDVRIHQY